MITNRINLKKCFGTLLVCLSFVMLLLPGAALADHEHEYEAVKTKFAPVDRVETQADAQFRKAMHMTYRSDADSVYGSGAILYHTLTVTGEVIGERQIYAVREIEELASLSMKNQAMHALALPASGMYAVREGQSETTVERNFAGLDLVKFLSLCGVPQDDGNNVYVQFHGAAGEIQPAAILTWRELQDYNKASADTPALLAFGLYDNKPLVKDAASDGYSGCCGNAGGPLRLVIPRQGEAALCIDDVSKILVGKTADAVEPRYDLHNRTPFDGDSMIKTFTVNVYDNAAAEGAAPLKTRTFTTDQLERLALDHPEHVVGNYYGIIGDRHIMNSMGLGGWLDYFEGIDLWWLLEDQVGLPSVKGRAVFYGRDGLAYTTVDNLRYLNNRSGDYSNYTITTQEAVNIPNAVPMIAFSKNGYPLLPEHDHESSAYHDYNRLNQALTAAGVPCEVGVIKNHNGPFVACLGNVDNLYGGYQVETGGDCIRADLYLDLPKQFADVQGHWAEEAVSFVLAQDLFQGASENAFEADSAMTRGMLVTVLGRLAGAAHSIAADFTDVPADAYYAPYVAWANQAGVAMGADGKFNPEAQISRQDMAAMLARYIQEVAKKTLPEKDAARTFNDEAEISDYAKDAVSMLQKAGIIVGNETGAFLPANPVTRAEAAKMISVLMSLLS